MAKNELLAAHELLPRKFWAKFSKPPRVSGAKLADKMVLIGWLYRHHPKHYLVTEIEYGIYSGIVVDRENERITTFGGQVSNKHGLDALLVQGVMVDKTCGFGKYTVGECFRKFNWKQRILDNEQVTRQDSKR